MTRFAKILLPRPLHEPFDYAVPEGMSLSEGDYVRVPFGSKSLNGVVWELTGSSEAKKIKEVTEAYPLLLLSPEMRKFVKWVASYTLSPLGSVLAMVISVPKALEVEKKAKVTKEVQAKPKLATLSSAQKEAAKFLVEKLESKFSVTLLDGVTGSGKTEVYLEAVAKAIEEDGQVLVMVPEIILTSQLMARFTERLGFTPTLWHSALTPKQRRDGWRAITMGEAKLVVGARSALFLPFKNLQLIVVDEEHESAYKQEDNVIYQGRDMAIARCSHEAIPIVLVSATPSLETMINCQKGKYERLHLPERHADAALPEITLVDMRREKLSAQEFISGPLRAALVETVAKGQQALLFLNRRGYAPLLLCRTCGYRFQCPNCSAWLVEHRALNRLQCHHCGLSTRIPKECPKCHEADCLMPCGPGVERLEEEVRGFMPEARVTVVTSDTVATMKAAKKLMNDITEQNIDIIIGTQMVAKGHHFPNLTLVGVVDADLGLEGGDLRAGEKSFQMLTQVAGRAGREEARGHVFIQSYMPEHPVMQALYHVKRDAFVAYEAEIRKRLDMPPFGRLAALILSGPSETAIKQFANHLARTQPHGEGFSILGPAPAPLALLNKRYRYRFLVKAQRDVKLQALISHWLAQVQIPSSVRLRVDIDPYNFL